MEKVEILPPYVPSIFFRDQLDDFLRRSGPIETIEFFCRVESRQVCQVVASTAAELVDGIIRLDVALEDPGPEYVRDVVNELG